MIGTEQEMERVVYAYSDAIRKIAFTYLHSVAEAEDAAQDVFLKLLTRAPTFKDEAHEKAWIIRATVNLCKDRLRRAERRNLPLEEVSETVSAPETGELLKEVLALPEKYRTVIHLHYYEGYTVREMAAILKRPVGTVATHLERGRALLKERLKGEFDL